MPGHLHQIFTQLYRLSLCGRTHLDPYVGFEGLNRRQIIVLLFISIKIIFQEAKISRYSVDMTQVSGTLDYSHVRDIP